MTTDDPSHDDDESVDDDEESSYAWLFLRMTPDTVHDVLLQMHQNQNMRGSLEDLLCDDVVLQSRYRPLFALFVGRVCWDGSHQPYAEYTCVRTWEEAPTEQAWQAAIQAAYHDPRFFVVCTRCGSRCNTGHMYSTEPPNDICQGCAAMYLGVVY